MLSECIYKVLMASGVVTSSDACDLSSAIEAAVLEAQKQEPVAWCVAYDDPRMGRINSNPSMCEPEVDTHVSKCGGVVVKVPLYAAPVVQPQQEPVGKPHRWNDDGERCLDCGDKDWMADKYCSAAPVVQDNPESAISRYLRYMEGVKEPDPVERLRFFCSIAMNGRDWIDSEQFFADLAPIVPPDMVMVPREPTEAMLDAAMNRYQHVSPEAKARYTQMHRENFRCDYKAMIAAAEGK